MLKPSTPREFLYKGELLAVPDEKRNARELLSLFVEDPYCWLLEYATTKIRYPNRVTAKTLLEEAVFYTEKVRLIKFRA